MNGRIIIRGVSVYYLVLVCLLFWNSVFTPLYRIIVSSPGAELVDILSTFPFLLLIFFLLFIVRGLTRHSAWIYGLTLVIQCGMILFSLVSSYFSLAFGVVSTGISVYIFLLLLHPSVQQTIDDSASRAPHQKSRAAFDRVIVIGLFLSILLLIGWCGASIYTAETMSGYTALTRFAGLPNGQFSSEEIRSALFERTPIGTEKGAIISLLEMSNIPKDRFVGGQFVRYQEDGRAIVALFSTPPWVVNLFCSQYHVGVRYIFDETHQLEDIVIENYWFCL